MHVDEIDFKSPEFLADPYPFYDLMRREAPIHYRDDWQMYFLSTYEDVDALLRDRRLGRQFSHVMSREEVGLRPTPAEHRPFYDMNDNMLMDKEPPAHTRLKLLVNKAFTPRTVRDLRPRIEQIAVKLVEEMKRQRDVNLIEAFAAPLSVTVIAELLGVPEADRHRLRPWSGDIVAMYELGGVRSQGVAQRAVEAVQAFTDYLRDLVQRRRRQPQQDLISALAAAEDGGERLSEEELIATCILILNAGHEATVNAVGNGILALSHHPQQMAALREEPALLETAVEEILRYDTPLPFFRRWVLETFGYKGVRFEKGTEVGFLLASANHDPAVFETPEQFDVRRRPNPHLSFGMGVHYCLGAPLARAELQIGLKVLLQHLERLEVETTTIEHHPTFVFRGLKTLPVRVA